MPSAVRLALVLILLLAAGARLRYFTGFQNGDDTVYSKIAVERLHGNVTVTNVHETRMGFLLPIIASYALFGPGEGPLVLYNLLCSIALVAAVFFLARRFSGDIAGLMAAVVTAIHPNLIYHATECHTDTPLALWESLAVLAFLSALDEERPARRLVLTGLLFGWGYLHKVNAFFLIPFFAGHWIATKRRWTWYLPLALTVLGVFLAEFLTYACLTGDPLERFSQIRHWHSGQYMRELYPTVSSVVSRLFFDLPHLFFTPHYGHRWQGTLNLCGLVFGVLLLARRVPRASFLAGWWATIYLCFCFWPSSVVPFRPGFYLHEWTFPVLIAPLACFIGAALSRWSRLAAVLGLSILVCLGLYSAHGDWMDGTRLAEGSREAHAWVGRENPARVISDEKTVEALDFFDHHSRHGVYTPFAGARDYAGAAVIVNKFWAEEGQWWSQPIPPGVRTPPPTWKKAYESERIVIYLP